MGPYRRIAGKPQFLTISQVYNADTAELSGNSNDARSVVSSKGIPGIRIEELLIVSA